MFGCGERGSTEVRTHHSLCKTQGDLDWFREAVYEFDVALGTRDDNPRLPLHLVSLHSSSRAFRFRFAWLKLGWRETSIDLNGRASAPVALQSLLAPLMLAALHPLLASSSLVGGRRLLICRAP